MSISKVSSALGVGLFHVVDAVRQRIRLCLPYKMYFSVVLDNISMQTWGFLSLFWFIVLLEAIPGALQVSCGEEEDGEAGSCCSSLCWYCINAMCLSPELWPRQRLPCALTCAKTVRSHRKGGLPGDTSGVCRSSLYGDSVAAVAPQRLRGRRRGGSSSSSNVATSNVGHGSFCAPWCWHRSAWNRLEQPSAALLEGFRQAEDKDPTQKLAETPKQLLCACVKCRGL